MIARDRLSINNPMIILDAKNIAMKAYGLPCTNFLDTNQNAILLITPVSLKHTFNSMYTATVITTK